MNWGQKFLLSGKYWHIKPPLHSAELKTIIEKYYKFPKV